MKAQATRAGGRHAAKERGAVDLAEVPVILPIRKRFPFFDFLSARSIAALLDTIRSLDLELRRPS